MQNACAVLSTSLILPYFSTLSLKRNGFRKKTIEHKMCISFSLQLLFETFLILGTIEGDIMINIHGPSRNVSGILVRFAGNLNFLDRFSKNT